MDSTDAISAKPIHRAEASQTLSMPTPLLRLLATRCRGPLSGRSTTLHAKEASRTPPHPLRGRSHQPSERAVSGNPIPVGDAGRLG
jgi:hypothetical protein